MSEEPRDDIEMEEAEPVDGSFLDVSVVEEVNSNSQENYCCVFVIRLSDVKPIWYGTVHLRFQRSKKPLSDVPSQTCPKLRIPDIKRRNFP